MSDNDAIWQEIITVASEYAITKRPGEMSVRDFCTATGMTISQGREYLERLIEKKVLKKRRHIGKLVFYSPIDDTISQDVGTNA